MLKDKLKKSLFIALWFGLLTFPLMVTRVNTIENTIRWRWINLPVTVIAAFALSFLWNVALERKERGTRTSPRIALKIRQINAIFTGTRKRMMISTAIVVVVVVVFPFVTSFYQLSIMNTALMYVMLGLGLNIVIGLGGILHLGYIAFFLVGSYSYALLNQHFGLNFWLALPIGGVFSGPLRDLSSVPGV